MAKTQKDTTASNVNGLPLPKLNLVRLSVYFSDLFLVSDDSIEWVREQRVRRIWHVYFFSVLSYTAISFVGSRALDPILETSSGLTLVFRSASLASMIWLICLDIALALAHYRYLLRTAFDLKISSILFFWYNWIILFAISYRELFYLRPSLFIFPNAPFVPTKLTTVNYLQGIYTTLYFLIYSLCTSLSFRFPAISSSSSLIALINVAEIIGNLLFIALLVATFVSMSASRPKY